MRDRRRWTTARRAPCQPRDVRRGRVGAGPELVEVSAAAEGRAGAAQHDPLDRVVDERRRQCRDSSSRSWAVIALWHAGTIEHDLEPVGDPDGSDDRSVVDHRSGTEVRTPGGELRARLQHRVRRRLEGEPVLDRDAGERPEQHGQSARCERMAGDGRHERLDVTRPDDDVGGRRPDPAELVADPAHDDGQGAGIAQGRDGHRAGRAAAVDEEQGDPGGRDVGPDDDLVGEG